MLRWGRSGQEHPFVIVEGDTRGDRHDDPAGEPFADRDNDRFDLMGLDGHDDHIGECRHLLRAIECPESMGFRIAAQFGGIARTGPDPVGRQRPGAHEAPGKGLRHVTESDKTYLHIFHVLFFCFQESPRKPALRNGRYFE